MAKQLNVAVCENPTINRKILAESKINQLQLSEGLNEGLNEGLMTGKVHTEDGEYLYHKKELPKNG
jgi:hypothetical protein